MGRKKKKRISQFLNVWFLYKITNFIIGSVDHFFSHSLNDKSLQVTEIHDLNNGKSNI